MSQHTPGPWYVFSETHPRVGPSHMCTVAGIFKPIEGSQAANAQLIAAAPELLERLKQSIGLSKMNQSIEDWLNASRKLIYEIEPQQTTEPESAQ